MRLIFACLAFTAVAGAAEPLTVMFTGKLLGYARNPNEQRVRQIGVRVGRAVAATCPSAQSCPRLYEFDQLHADSPVAAELNRLIVYARTKAANPTLLLGMGDNFAMDYFSRVVVATMLDGTQEYVPKDVLFYDADVTKYWIDLRDVATNSVADRDIRDQETKGRALIPEDNVARFFARAEYHALVPGQHDLYFGAERLREIARLLAPATMMLGANLVLQSKRVQPPPELDEHQRAQKRNFVKKAGTAEWALPTSPLPWMRRLRLKNGSGVIDQTHDATLCTTADRDFRPALGSNCRTLSKPVTERTDLAYSIEDTEPLASETTWIACARLRTPVSEQEYICETADVLSPLFQYPETTPVIGQAGNQPVPKLLSALRTALHRPWVRQHGHVVMGVMAPGLESLAGALNTSYLNEEARWDTTVATIDPADALVQLVEYCVAVGDCAGDVPMILMAQMPRDETAVLISRMAELVTPRFVLGIAQADRRFATSAIPVTWASGHRPVVLVPGELLQKDTPNDQRSVQLYSATLSGGVQPSVSTVAVRSDVPVTSLAACPALTSAIDAVWNEITRGAAADPETKFRNVVLHAMRSRLKTDVAVLQERDLFELSRRATMCATGPLTGPEQMRFAVEQVLWKGDFLVSTTVTGAALKGAVKQSDAWSKLEKSYNTALATGRALVTLGLVKDAQETWYVNGGPVDDKTTYSIALPDYLVGGDTGYTDLKDPAVPPSPRPRELRQLSRLSDAVMRTLTPAHAPRPLDAATYLDWSAHRPFQPSRRASFWKQVLQIHHTLLERRPAPDSAATKLGQERPYWRLLLDKGEVGFTSYEHNRETQDNLQAAFAGTTYTGVLARRAITIPLAVHAEARLELKHLVVFARNEFEYSSQATQQDGPKGRDLTTYPSNRNALEIGLRGPWSGSTRSQPWFGWLASVVGETNVHAPVLDAFKVGASCDDGSPECPKTVSFPSSVARMSRVQLKGGARADGGLNWSEAGLFVGSVFRPVAFQALRNGTPLAEAFCRLSNLLEDGKPVELNKCLTRRFTASLPNKDSSPDVAETLTLNTPSGSKREWGVFLNFNYRVAVPRNPVVKDLYFEQRGQWFKSNPNDSVLDAKLIEKFTFGPTLTVAPNLPGLSLKPSITKFFYRNKVAANWLNGTTFDIKLEYRFDWKTGASVAQVLRYGRAK